MVWSVVVHEAVVRHELSEVKLRWWNKKWQPLVICCITTTDDCLTIKGVSGTCFFCGEAEGRLEAWSIDVEECGGLSQMMENQLSRAQMSEVSCENCTHVAVAAKKMRLYKGCYTQRDSGGNWTTSEMSGQGSHHGYWDSKGMYEDENTVIV